MWFCDELWFSLLMVYMFARRFPEWCVGVVCVASGLFVGLRVVVGFWFCGRVGAICCRCCVLLCLSYVLQLVWLSCRLGFCVVLWWVFSSLLWGFDFLLVCGACVIACRLCWFSFRSHGMCASWCFWGGGCCFRFGYRLTIVELLGFEFPGSLFWVGDWLFPEFVLGVVFWAYCCLLIWVLTTSGLGHIVLLLARGSCVGDFGWFVVSLL